MESQPEVINNPIPQTSVIPENPPLPTPVQQPKFTPQKNNLRMIIIIVCLTLVLIGGIAYYFLSKKSNNNIVVNETTTPVISTNNKIENVQQNNEQVLPTSPSPALMVEPLLSVLKINSNTKEYANSNYKFTISYPEYFQIYEDSSRGIIAFYYGDNKYNLPDPYYCSVVHFEISIGGDTNCGSLAYKGTSTKTTETKSSISGFPSIRYDDFIQDIPLESRYEEFGVSNKYQISFYNGGKTIGEAEKIRALLLKMSNSFKLTD